MDQIAGQGRSGEQAEKGLGREASADRYRVTGLTGTGALVVEVVFLAAEAARIGVRTFVVVAIVLAVGMVAAAMEGGGVVVPMAAVAVFAVIVSLSSASPSVAFPLDLDSTVQRVDRLPMEE
ncbi:MAG: hypothetical protein E6K71_11115, partial [Candidatus Eisenbacteria bacterium]